MSTAAPLPAPGPCNGAGTTYPLASRSAADLGQVAEATTAVEPHAVQTDPIAVLAHSPGQEYLLTPAALAFLGGLHRRFDCVRRARLADRRDRQAIFDAGGVPGFRADTCQIRESAWRVAPLPDALLDRRVEITGPVTPKMVINALNCAANCFMADFEDSTSPTWPNLLGGQHVLRQAVAGTLQWRAAGPDSRQYTLKPSAQQAVLMVRPRGWHLDEKHLHVDGMPMAASLFDLGLFAFHNAAALAAKDRGPYFYLPKLESMEEARLWNDVLDHIEQALHLVPGQIRVTVLIETLPAVFEMDEILHALRSRIAGLNCGRWDYVFSYIKTFRLHRDKVLPERAQVTMTQPFLRAYSQLLIDTCHRRGAHAMGGMAAQIPISGTDPASVQANQRALDRVGADKLREVLAGHDGTWVAHPGLIALAKSIFDQHMPTPHQQHVGRWNRLDDGEQSPGPGDIGPSANAGVAAQAGQAGFTSIAAVRGDPDATRDALTQPPVGTITRAGFEGNVEVCVRYLAAWLDGNGCVPIHGLMEDAATAEIARSQLWQWLHADGQQLDDGVPIDSSLLEGTLLELPRKLSGLGELPGASRIDEAIAMLHRLSHADMLEEFLTLPAYARLE